MYWGRCCVRGGEIERRRTAKSFPIDVFEKEQFLPQNEKTAQESSDIFQSFLYSEVYLFFLSLCPGAQFKHKYPRRGKDT